MATKYLYAIYDNVAKEIGPISQYNNDDQAKRVYQVMMEKTENVNVEDFNMYRIGIIDINSMEITILDKDIII